MGCNFDVEGMGGREDHTEICEDSLRQILRYDMLELIYIEKSKFSLLSKFFISSFSDLLYKVVRSWKLNSFRDLIEISSFNSVGNIEMSKYSPW